MKFLRMEVLGWHEDKPRVVRIAWKITDMSEEHRIFLADAINKIHQDHWDEIHRNEQ